MWGFHSLVSSKLIVSLLNVLSWCCFKWILFLLQTCSHTYCVSSSFLGNYFEKGFYISVYPLPQLCENVTFWSNIPKGCHSFSRKSVLPCPTVLKVYILLLALFKCLGQSCRCLRFLEQCLGYLFELVTVHRLILLGSIVHEECFWFHLHFV